jgi:hypothetical protein
MDSSQRRPRLQYVPDLEVSIRRHPLESVGVGFLAGFVVGGGQRSRIGQGLIGFAARLAVRQVTMVALSQSLRQS